MATIRQPQIKRFATKSYDNIRRDVFRSIRQTQKEYCSIAIIIAIAVSAFFILAEQKYVGKGLMLGAIFSIINFILIGEAIPMQIGSSIKKIKFISFGSLFFRYIILAIPIIMGIKLEQFNITAVVCSMFSVQLVIFFDHLIKYRPIRKTGL
jgi:hypothetical protein